MPDYPKLSELILNCSQLWQKYSKSVWNCYKIGIPLISYQISACRDKKGLIITEIWAYSIEVRYRRSHGAPRRSNWQEKVRNRYVYPRWGPQDRSRGNSSIHFLPSWRCFARGSAIHTRNRSPSYIRHRRGAVVWWGLTVFLITYLWNFFSDTVSVVTGIFQLSHGSRRRPRHSRHSDSPGAPTVFPVWRTSHFTVRKLPCVTTGFSDRLCKLAN